MMLNWIISSSLLIVAVIVLRFSLRGKVSPAIGYALWLVVLVRLAMGAKRRCRGVKRSRAVQTSRVSPRPFSTRTVSARQSMI